MPGEAVFLPFAPAAYPAAPIKSLDTLWFQVSGTICNLECKHCFISCHPKNNSHEMLSLADVLPYLEDARTLGVRAYYFTGGEPLMNRELFEILEATLRQGPATVLTNGVLIKESTAQRLRTLFNGSEYSLDLRISLDGYDAATNDPIRGEGTFERILLGVRRLAEVGLSPVITVSEVCADAATRAGRSRFLDFLRSIGLPHPRLKLLPLIRLGAEEHRERAYHPHESLAHHLLAPEELERLQCTSGRMVTSKGVYVCPILIEAPGALMGRSLSEALRPFSLRYSACWTCHVEGLSCAT